MKTTYRDKYKKLEKEVSDKIRGIILTKGEVSDFISDYVLKLKDEQQYNLEGCNTYAVEISEGIIIGKNGHHFNYNCLSLEQLCEIVDSF